MDAVCRVLVEVDQTAQTDEQHEHEGAMSMDRRSVTFAVGPDSTPDSGSSGRDGRRITSCFSSTRSSGVSEHNSVPVFQPERRSAISLEDEAKKASAFAAPAEGGPVEGGPGEENDLTRDASGRLGRRAISPLSCMSRTDSWEGMGLEDESPAVQELERVWIGVSCSKCRLKIQGCVLVAREDSCSPLGLCELGRTEAKALMPGAYTNFMVAVPIVVPKSRPGDDDPEFSKLTVMIYLADDDACLPLTDLKNMAASRVIGTRWISGGSMELTRGSTGECESMDVGRSLSIVLQDSTFLDACHVHLTVLTGPTSQAESRPWQTSPSAIPVAAPPIRRYFVLKGNASCEGLGQPIERPVGVTIVLGEEIEALPLTWAIGFQVLKIYHTDHILMLRAIEEEIEHINQTVDSKHQEGCVPAECSKFDRDDFEESVLLTWLYQCALLMREHLRAISLNIEVAETGSFYSPILGRHVDMKPSCSKADPAVRFLTTNLHVQRTLFSGFVDLVCNDHESFHPRLPTSVFPHVTCGVFSDIAGIPDDSGTGSVFVLRSQALEVQREIEKNAVHDHNGLLKGVLEKRGASFPYLWRTRIFTFDGEWLTWFKNEGEAAQGRLNVRKEVREVSISDGGRQLHLDTSTPGLEGRVYQLYSKDTEAIVHWNEILDQAINPHSRMTMMTLDETSQWTNWGSSDLVESESKRELRLLALRATLRLDAAFSQALAALVAAFCQSVEAALTRSYPGAEDILSAMADFGFLFCVQSLLSNSGSEADMLGDCFEACKLLRHVQFRIKVVCMHGAAAEEDEQPRGVIHSGIIVEQGSAAHSQPIQKGWPCHYYHFDVEVPVRCELELIPERIQRLEPISVQPLMFTMGINANSTLSNLTKGAAKEGSLQHYINDRSVSSLKNHYHSACMLRIQQKETQEASVLADTLHALFIEIYNAHTKPQSNKNTRLLALSARYTVLAGGAVCTMCKSGKDRTGMAVTLAEGRQLVDVYQEVLASTGVHAEAFLDGDDVRSDLVQALRTHGVRRQNCLANTGKPFFAFHSIQQMFLPDEFKPPKSICLSSVQT